jgi:anti-sigma regulatory factor (Ser/Thr protein kinase)
VTAVAAVDTARRLTLGLPAEAVAVSTARHQVVAQCRRWGLPGEATDRVALVVSELAGNAVQHAGGAFRLVVRKDRDEVTVEVEDPLRRPEPVAYGSEGDGEHGLGLVLVEQLAARWGYVLLPHGKRVWANIPTRDDS